MKTKFIITLFISLFIAGKSVRADSPLTSTAISKAYHEEAIVQQAAEAEGTLTSELADYLIDKSNPVALKVALINQLGWDIDGKNNAVIFVDHLIQNGKYQDENDIMNKADDTLLISLAYLKAMDNYFKVDDAIKIADKALSKDRKSYTINIITALIKAQQAMEKDWCRAYKLTYHVLVDESLNEDLSLDAINIIFDYMDLYADAC